MKCICCNNSIKNIESQAGNSLSLEDSVFGNIKKYNRLIEKAENRMWSNGVVGNISAGYGSSHDGGQYVIAICDDCIQSKLDEGVLAYTGHYIFKDIKGDIEKYRKIWRRNNNLDNLDI